MDEETKKYRDLEKLQEARRRAHERMTQQRDRVDKRFDKIYQKIEQKYGDPSDSQQRIINAALDLLKDNGLNNLSLRKLADKLDMKAPALYWHFNSKDVLIDYMAEAILRTEFNDLQPKSDDQPWQDWLKQQMYKLRKAMLVFPDGARVVAGAHLYPAVTLGLLFECALESLESAGFSSQEALLISMTASTYTFGFVIEEQSSPSLEEIGKQNLDAMRAPYPHLVKAMHEAHSKNRNLDENYKVGLDYIIKGATAG